MADIRINALPTTASASSSDDYIALDGTTNGTRKLNAYSPTFGGNLTVSGTGAFGGAVSTLVSTNGENRLSNRNTSAGAAAYSSFLLGNDSAPNLGALYALSTGFTTSAQYVADTLVIESSRAAGMGISTTNGGPIKFWHNGVNTATFTSSAATLAGNLTVSGGTIGTAASTNLTLNGGSSGAASIVLGQGSSGNIKTSVSISNTAPLFTFIGGPQSTDGQKTRIGIGCAGFNGFESLTPAISAVQVGTVNFSGLAFEYYAGARAEGFRLNTTGNLLIGTTTDGGQKLQVAGSAKFNFATNTNITLSGSGTISSISSLNDAGIAYQPLYVSGSVLTFNIGGSESARFAATTGNLLLGTTTDGGQKLQVNGTALILSTLTIQPSSATPSLVIDGQSGQYIANFKSSGTQRAAIWSDGRIIGTSGSAASPAFTFLADQTSGLYYNGSNGIVLSSNATAALTLDSSQNATFAGNIVIDKATPSILIKRGANTQDGVIAFATGGNGDFFVGNRGTSDSDLHIYNYGLAADAVTISKNTSNATFAGDVLVQKSLPLLRLNNTGSGAGNWVHSVTTATGEYRIGEYGVGDYIIINKTSGQIDFYKLFRPQQAATAPTYVKGAIYFDTTLNKLRVGGATGWETITSV